MYKIADTTLVYIGGEEGFAPTRYPDGGFYTIGYGHQIQPGEFFAEPITRDQAKEILKRDLKSRIDSINKVLPPGYSQSQVNALLDYTMSMSAANVLKAKLFQLIAQRKPANEVKQWWGAHYITVNGLPSQALKNRRTRQIDKFFQNPYPALFSVFIPVADIALGLFFITLLSITYFIIKKINK